MHFPDFSMFVPVLGLPFLTGHIGKSLFPNSFFKSWPSGISAGVNPIGKALGAKMKEGQDEVAEMRQQFKEKGLWNTLFNRGDKTNLEKDALREVNKMDAATARKILDLRKKLGDVRRAVEREKDPAKKEALKLEQNALSMKIRKLEGESTDSSGNVLDYSKGGSTYETKLKTANEQGGAKAVIESISTTASYDKNETEVVTVPAPKKTAVEDISGTGGGATAPLVTSGGGGEKDAYEILYKGS